MKGIGLGLIIFVGSFFSVRAQEKKFLTLQDALTATLSENKELTLARLDEEIATAKYRQTHGVFLPQIKLSYSVFSTNNPLNAFGFKLQQQSVAPSDFNPEVLNSPSSIENYMSQVEWQQPIFNGDMLYMRRAANNQVEMYSYKKKRTKEYLKLEVQKAYAQLQLAHQAVDVLEESFSTMTSILKTVEDKFEVGFVQKADVLLVQVQQTNVEKQLAEARSNVQNASDYLSLLMGKQAGVIYEVDRIEKALPIDVEVNVPANRADFQALQSALNAQEMMIAAGRMSYLPRVNAFANYMINDKEAFGFGSDSYLVGAQLSWNIFNGMATQNKIAQQKMERNKIQEQLNYQKEQNQVELNKTIRQLSDLRVTIRQNELAVAQAEEALRIQQDRHHQGLVATNDILQSEMLLSQQKLNQAMAYFQLRTTQGYLEFLTSASAE